MVRTHHWYSRSSTLDEKPATTHHRAGDWEGKLEEFQQAIGIRFKDIDQLRLAFTHSSSASAGGRRVRSTGNDNERLEYLGDAVLELVVSHLLYAKKPDYDEGQLTQLRSQLVNKHALAAQARGINLPDYIRLGKGEAASGGAYKSSINANGFEALIGAIYLDQDWETTYRFIEDLFVPHIDEASDSGVEKDSKSQLQEISLARYGTLPKYQVVGQRGREHDKVFQVKVLLNNRVASIGRGRSKKAAEQEAAALALKGIGAPG